MNAATAQVIMPTGNGWESFRTLDNDERRAAWASKYFAAGHHRRPRTNSTATNPQGCEQRREASVSTLPAPTTKDHSARAARIADGALIHPRYFYDDADPADLPDWHPDSHFCTSP